MALLGTAENWPSWYSSYGAYPSLEARAAWLNAEVPAGKLLVAGCGWGYLVALLNQLGRDAWGIDAAPFCFANRATPRVLQRSVLVRADLNAAKTAAGIASNGRFAGCLTEDLLPCLTGPNEVANALGEIRRATTRLLHVVTPGDGQAQPPGRTPEMAWRTHQEWKNLVGADLVMDTETGAVL